MNSFLGEKALNWSASPALMSAKPLESTRKPVPDVEKMAPRFELTLKKSAGKLSTLVRAAGTPSQLISRRPLSAGGEFGADFFNVNSKRDRKSTRLNSSHVEISY